MRYLFACIILLYSFTGRGQNQPYTDTTSYGPCGLGYVRHMHGFDTTSVTERVINDRATNLGGPIYTIPVVVHIIHNGGAENISDSVVHSQITALNENYGYYGQGYTTNPLALDCRIRFCLASVDPQGNPSTGIDRVKSVYTDIDPGNEMATKNLSRWDQKRYLNIWVVKSIKTGSTQFITKGYAYLPSDIAGNQDYQIDGVVIDYHYFGRNAPANPVNSRKGNTTTHEIGHYLDLKHPWGGDGPGQGGCDDDDGIDDTPDCDGKYFSQYNIATQQCAKPTQCGSVRLIEDYMDYSEDRCSNLFTKGQAIKMRNAIVQYRSDLISLPNEIATGCKVQYVNNNPATQNLLEIHPNPTTGVLDFYPYFTSSQNAEVYVFDGIGRTVMHFELNNLLNDKVQTSIKGLSPGIYELVVVMPQFIHKQKIILI